MASTTVESASSGTRGRKRRILSKNEGKKFVCTNDGCGRSFTRAEHLQRHLLNHSTGEYTCDRCRAHFKRRDLLGKNDVLFPWLADYMAFSRYIRCSLLSRINPWTLKTLTDLSRITNLKAPFLGR